MNPVRIERQRDPGRDAQGAAALLLFAALLWSGAAAAQTADDAPVDAPGKSPAQEVPKPYQSPLDKRIELEQLSQDNPFVLLSHKPTYLLPFAYNNRPNKESAGEVGEHLDRIEMKFQVSLKFSVWRRIFTENGHLSFAYTQQAYWQAFNSEISSPFRETNHEPEAILTFYSNFGVLGMRNRMLIFGYSHQSNGRANEASRSWNRLYANFVLERRNLVISLKPWYRIPEREKDDDNPDIEDYMGRGELSVSYENERNVYSLMFRNNLKNGDNRGAVQLDWSFPIKHNIKGYLQLFSGYGESLIDYNYSVNRVGLGIMLNDWL